MATRGMHIRLSEQVLRDCWAQPVENGGLRKSGRWSLAVGWLPTDDRRCLTASTTNETEVSMVTKATHQRVCSP